MTVALETGQVNVAADHAHVARDRTPSTLPSQGLSEMG